VKNGLVACGFATELSSLRATLPGLVEHGFYPELCPSLMFSLDEIRGYLRDGAARDAALLAGVGLTASWHGYYYITDLGAIDAHVRQYSLDVALNDLECAAAVGARDVVLHANYVPIVMDFLLDYWTDLFCKSFDVLVRRAEDMGLCIQLENVFDRDTRFLSTIMRRFETPHVGLCFDAGHWHVYSGRPLTDYLSALGGRVTRLHIHDNDGAIDRHWAVGEGSLDIYALTKSHGGAALTFENGGDIKKAALSRKVYERLADTPC